MTRPGRIWNPRDNVLETLSGGGGGLNNIRNTEEAV